MYTRLLATIPLLILLCSTTVRTVAEPLAPGTPAPNFVANGVSGGSTRLSDYRGRIVVLTFWATWCGPCNRAMPRIQAAYDRFHSQNVEFVCVCSWDTMTNAQSWVSAHRYTMTFAMDPAENDGAHAITHEYHVDGVPSTFLIDENGIIRGVDIGSDEEDIAENLAAVGVQSAGSVRGAATRTPSTGREVGRIDHTVGFIGKPLEIKGYLSSKPVDPYENLGEAAGVAKANAFVAKGRFDDAETLVRSMNKRHQTKLLGPVYNALGDHAMAGKQLDSAWGYYIMTVRNSSDPASVAHAHFGLADYFAATGDVRKAAAEYQAVLDLPGASDVDRDRARASLAK